MNDFVKAFEDLQQDTTKANAGFVSVDDLAIELEQSLSEEMQLKYKPVFEMFKNARFGLKLALIGSELAEWLEGVRRGKGADDHIPEFSCEEAEAADIIIRTMNIASDRRLRLAEAIIAKHNYNKQRKDHTPEARAAKGGKKF